MSGCLLPLLVVALPLGNASTSFSVTKVSVKRRSIEEVATARLSVRELDDIPEPEPEAESEAEPEAEAEAEAVTARPLAASSKHSSSLSVLNTISSVM